MSFQRVLKILLVVLLLGAGVWTFYDRRRDTGPCMLHAEVAIVSRDNPIAWATSWDTDTLSVRSGDAEDWDDVKVVITGFETVEGQRKAVGAYSASRVVVPARKLATFKLKEFTKAAGERWVSLTMKPTDVQVAATMHGRACRFEGKID